MIRFIYRILNRLRLSYFNLRYLNYRQKYNIHKSFGFNGVDIEMYGDGEIIIGKNSYIGNRSAIASVEGNKVLIGDNCSLSHNVRLYTTNRNPSDIIKNKSKTGMIQGDIIIGNNVWIGANVFVNQNVVIGDNVVIGANSVVTKNLDSNCIYAGSPAKLIKSLFNKEE